MKIGNPPSARRARTFRTLLAAAAVAATVVTPAGTAGAEDRSSASAQAALPDGSRTDGRKILPPPAGPWPKGAEFTVFLCRNGDAFDRCRERAITAEQRRALRTRLKAMPQVGKVRFESRLEAWKKFKAENKDNRTLLSAMSADDMPESFRGRLHRRADVAPFTSAIRKMPGVSNIQSWGGRFWTGKADVRVSLCGRKAEEGPCAGRGPVTEAEKDAIETRLSALREARRIYAEDTAHAKRVFEYFWANDTKFPIGIFQESYYVKLADRRDARAVIEAVEGMPGVDGVDVVDAG
ncbi:permease-like cell division protein FtsX [Planomonospora corallina]|uniref:Permease-like cell division protein FtsX n=1 Tax=Planomonospora corallina TaxID=1806052 RepID=A0ABV8I1H0_9ACTN